ncbi:MAG: hypothetical protein LBC53_04125 [Spirochaetaceae bacterium]|nr:hypothetical protein [Spirochaetaceae bacterium]
MTVKAFIPYAVLCLRRRYAARLLTALRKMFAKCGVKPLEPAADSAPMFAAALASCGGGLKNSCFTRPAAFYPIVRVYCYVLFLRCFTGDFAMRLWRGGEAGNKL